MFYTFSLFFHQFAHSGICPPAALPPAFGAFARAFVSFGVSFHRVHLGTPWAKPPDTRASQIHGSFPLHPGRARQGAGSPLETASPAAAAHRDPRHHRAGGGFKRGELIPTHGSLPIKEERGGPSGPGSLARAAGASRALCRLAVDARQANPGGAAAMEKSHHPTARWGCSRLRLLQAEANRAG